MRESKLWFWHILSAIVILVLLGLHMGTMHLSSVMSFFGIGSGHPTEASEVFHRSQQAVYMVIYVLLLGTALFHGLYGLRSMLLELSLPKGMEKAIGSVCAVAGVSLFVYGTYVAVRLLQMKDVLAQLTGVQP